LSSHVLSANLIKIYETKILYVVLYGCETWSLTLREEHRFRVCDNTVLKGLFGTKRKEVAGGWRRLHNEELHNFYASTNVFRMIKSRMGWAGYVARTGERKMHTLFWLEYLKGRDGSEGLGLEGKIILK